MSDDARVTLAKPDLADQALEGLVRAARFEATRLTQVVSAVAPIRRAPHPLAEQVDQLIFGERFAVLEDRDGWAWGQATRDGYVGWVDLGALGEIRSEPTHRIVAPSTLAFAEPSIKSPARGPFSLNALVTVEAVSGPLASVDGAGWMPAPHLCEIGFGFSEPAAVAERFEGTPYLWGGRTSLGLDCSGLVQQALFAAGLGCPRDADQQARIGRPAPAEDLRRGDLVLWRGHVGMMLDETRLIHANAFHMAVAIEPLATARARIAGSGGGEPTACRRPESVVWATGR